MPKQNILSLSSGVFFSRLFLPSTFCRINQYPGMPAQVAEMDHTKSSKSTFACSLCKVYQQVRQNHETKEKSATLTKVELGVREQLVSLQSHIPVHLKFEQQKSEHKLTLTQNIKRILKRHTISTKRIDVSRILQISYLGVRCSVFAQQLNVLLRLLQIRGSGLQFSLECVNLHLLRAQVNIAEFTWTRFLQQKEFVPCKFLP